MALKALSSRVLGGVPFSLALPVVQRKTRIRSMAGLLLPESGLPTPHLHSQFDPFDIYSAGFRLPRRVTRCTLADFSRNCCRSWARDSASRLVFVYPCVSPPPLTFSLWTMHRTRTHVNKITTTSSVPTYPTSESQSPSTRVAHPRLAAHPAILGIP